MLLGNAPGSFYKYRYPKHYSEKRGGARGAKVFIYKVRNDLTFEALDSPRAGFSQASN